MVKVIVVEKVRQVKGGKYPPGSYEYNFVTVGVLEIAPEELSMLIEHGLDSDLADRIRDELGFSYGLIQIQRKKSGTKYGGWEVLWEGEI